MSGSIGRTWWGWGFCRCSSCRDRNAESLHLSGEEVYAIGDTPGQLKAMLDGKFADGRTVSVFAESDLGKTIEFSATGRIDTPQEILYYQNGGICSTFCANWQGRVLPRSSGSDYSLSRGGTPTTYMCQSLISKDFRLDLGGHFGARRSPVRMSRIGILLAPVLF